MSVCMRFASIFAEGRFLRDESNYPAGKDNANDAVLQAGVSQQILKVVDRSFRSFFNLCKKAKPGEYHFHDVRIPHYLEKNAYVPLILSTNAIVIKDGLKSPCSGISTVASRRGKNPRSVSFAVGGPDGQRNTQHSDGENTVLAGAIRLRSVRLSAPDSVAR